MFLHYILVTYCICISCMQQLTGGTLLSRNKEFIVFYRGNDFLPPVVTKTLTERQKSRNLQQEEEEKARERPWPWLDLMLKLL